ncbi:MAG: hypothetical protein V2A65_04680 [Candidatus Omnitrophota bacterium]
MMNMVEKYDQGWRIRAGGLILDLDAKTGSLSNLRIGNGKGFLWAAFPGKVTVRDDLLGKTFGGGQLKQVLFSRRSAGLEVTKVFEGAPWILKESYLIEEEALRWEAEVFMESGEFRSCALGYHLPWPQPLWPLSFWAARENMPSAPHQFFGSRLEYGEINGGISMPALCSYHQDKDVGLLIAMPFDFRTPRFSFLSDYRHPDLRVEFDWLALAPGRSAKANLLFRATGGDWRPALGWLYQRYREYFEPRSSLIHSLWGGHLCGTFHLSPEEASTMAALGLTWYEIHEHFPAYGNYHPEKFSWKRSGGSPDERKNKTPRSVKLIRQTIRTLHNVGAAALPYIQITGDADAKTVSPKFPDSLILDRQGQPIYVELYDVYQLNSDPSFSFGKDVVRQIKGMVGRYPEMDGVFLDQACYNWLDTGHHDGITAVNNRPGYMTGFNYLPHLKLLSSLLHPDKVIIANGPFGIGIMKYIDGFMAEGSDWLCEQSQYYGLAKPMFFLVYDTTDRDIELMFQRCLIYAAGFTSYPAAIGSKDLYEKYVPLLKRLFRRRWVFDPNPLLLPTGYKGGIYRSFSGTLMATIVSVEPRLANRMLRDNSVVVQTSGLGDIKQVTVQQPGTKIIPISFKKEHGKVLFDIPGDTVAGVVELK